MASDELRPHIPESLELDLHGGRAWLGITPFRVTGLRLRGTLPLPGVSSFLELNVRTYVSAGGKPGIWFFSLDADSRLAVETARRAYRLPYFRARISSREREGWLQLESARAGKSARVFDVRYRGTGPALEAEPGSREHFLTERYCLYAEHGGRLFRAEIHHAPWALRPAEAVVELNTMTPAGVDVSAEPLFHLAARQDVVLWPLHEVGTRTG